MKLLSLIPKLTKHVIQIRNWRPLWYQLLEKHIFILHTRHTQQKINGSTLFAINNMYYANFRTQEQESIPWCGEIQNQRLEVLENTFNLHSNSTLCPRSVVSQSDSNGRIREWLTLTYTPFHSLWKTLMKFCMFFSLYLTDYLIGPAF